MTTETKRFDSALTEAANRAEATALLIRCGFRVYRPEADTHGEDLVIRDRESVLHPVQLKGRAWVDERRYGGRGIMMLFPSSRYDQSTPREWFLVPHDHLFDWIEDRHGMSPKWDRQWSYPSLPKQLREFLASYIIVPPAEPAASAVTESS